MRKERGMHGEGRNMTKEAEVKKLQRETIKVGLWYMQKAHERLPVLCRLS